jgi:prephenate dehydrogenase
LMGGSLAMALNGKCARLVGCDRDPKWARQAEERGIVERAASQAGEILAESDVVVLATPVRSILKLLEALPQLHPGRAVVLDLGSTKRQIVEAMERLPVRFDPVGGHPMCGKEKGTLENAEAELFRGATFGLVELERSSTKARRLAEELARVIGAEPVWIEVESHDALVAYTSHLPFLIANALAAGTPLESRRLVGPGWRSTSRLAATPDKMMIDVLATNRDNVLRAVDRFEKQLGEMKARLRDGDEEGLRKLVQEGAGRYRELVNKEAGV